MLAPRAPCAAMRTQRRHDTLPRPRSFEDTELHLKDLYKEVTARLREQKGFGGESALEDVAKRILAAQKEMVSAYFAFDEVEDKITEEGRKEDLA